MEHLALSGIVEVANFAVAVAHYRDLTNASVTSWGRSHERNARVGGAPRSLHLVDLAVDVVYDRPLALDTARELAAPLGLHVRREADHDHLEPLRQGV